MSQDNDSAEFDSSTSYKFKKKTLLLQMFVKRFDGVGVQRLKTQICSVSRWRGVETGFRPGPPSLQLPLGPRRCRCSRPVEMQHTLIIIPLLRTQQTAAHPRDKLFTICHTCMMLSSDTEQMTHGSLGFQEKSEILAVCPPWMN